MWRGGNALPFELGRSLGGERVETQCHGRAGVHERLLDRRLAHRRLVGQAHAVGREHAGQRMDEDPRHAERIGDAAGVLAAGTAEALQGVARDVVAARHRDLLDRVGHAADRDVDEALGDLLRRPGAAGRLFDLRGERRELRAHDGSVERLVALRPEHLGKERRLDLADGDVRIGDRERPAAPVRRRPRIGARALRPDPKARAVESEDRAAACGHRMDRHHGRADAHAGDAGLEGPLELAGVVAHVGRGATHVEADDADAFDRVLETELRGSHHADDAARRARQDRVLALKAAGFGKTARRLHEIQAHAWHLGRDLVDVATQDRREIGIDHRRVAAPDELHQRADLVRHAHLREAGRARQRLGRGLVLGEPPAVHEDDGDAAQA